MEKLSFTMIFSTMEHVCLQYEINSELFIAVLFGFYVVFLYVCKWKQ